MTINDTLHETVIALSANRVRSGLTILGIVIGISSVITLVAVGQGSTSSITSSISSLGSNLLTVSPGAQRNVGGFGAANARGSAQTLTMDDADAVAQLSGVNTVAQAITSRQQVTAKGTNTNTSIEGVSSNYADVRNVEIAAGSFVTDLQNQSGAKVAVLGPTAMTDLFGDDAEAESTIGQKIRIKGSEFTVIGVTVSKGSTGFNNQDDVIYVPVKTAARYFSGNSYLSSISVQAQSADVMTQVQNDITSLLLTRHKKTEDTADFTVQNQADLLSSLSAVTSTLTILLGAIAGISLLVGGIGIMNMMLTNVTERTREIGLRKAIGARPSDISRQFLAEAVALTVIGGVVGIVLGWSLAYAINVLGLVTTTVSLSSVVLAFGVSALIGIVFGYYPARRAAGLNPIEALRYE